jgi:hypothetical protein
VSVDVFVDLLLQSDVALSDTDQVAVVDLNKPHLTTDQWRLLLAPLCRKVLHINIPELVALQQRLSQIVLEFTRVELI